MPLAPLRAGGKLELRSSPLRGCPWEGCDGVMEYWDERIFDHTFPAMGCSKCQGFWIWGEDAGEWLCSMNYVEWKSRVYGQV